MASMHYRYGQLAASSQALNRVARMLCSDRGRQKVQGCMKDKIPLHGMPNSNDYGIEECRNIAMAQACHGCVTGVTRT